MAFFVLPTTPAWAHTFGRAAYLGGERMNAPEPVDEETNRDLK